MPTATPPLPPACFSLAVCEWLSEPHDGESFTFHLWQRALDAGELRTEINEDDNTTRLVYVLDVTPEVSS